MKGRNTGVVSIRLPDSILKVVEARAKAKNLSVGDYLKAQIIKSSSVNTTEPALENDTHRVNTIKQGQNAVSSSVNTTGVFRPGVTKEGETVNFLHYGVKKTGVFAGYSSDGQPIFNPL